MASEIANLTLSKRQSRSKREIEDEANRILTQHGLNSLPVDLITLANQEGIKVHNAKFSEDQISAMIAKRGTNITILVNQSDHPNRKRFSIAHELGHHFLHLLEDGEIIDTEIDLFRGEFSGESTVKQRSKEIEANQFASALLMPADLVKKYYSEKTIDLSELARLFRVSEEAMGYRITQLGLD
jgi:Zn-dependent peptidase ImmA (M78 family)